eukprot:350288-Pelagomonas_calceolata.AAC.1
MSAQVSKILRLAIQDNVLFILYSVPIAIVAIFKLPGEGQKHPSPEKEGTENAAKPSTSGGQGLCEQQATSMQSNYAACDWLCDGSFAYGCKENKKAWKEARSNANGCLKLHDNTSAKLETRALGTQIGITRWLLHILLTSVAGTVYNDNTFSLWLTWA